MSAMSDYLENKLLDHILAVTPFSAPSNVYLGLSIASMGEDASGTELSGNGYARVGPVAFDAASGGTTDNTAVLDFPACTGSNWGAVAYWSIWDTDGTSSAGNMLLHGAFTSAKTIEVNDVLRIAAGDLDITAA